MKKVIRCIAFLVIMFLVLGRTYDILKWKDTSGDYLSSTKQLYSTEDNLIDIVFFGSSHCYCGISPDVLWGDYGFAAFNMTTSGQDKMSTSHLLKEVLKTQSPNVVCVELWGLTFDEHAVEGNVHRNMLAMDLSQNSISLIKEYIDEEEQMDYILRWPIVHTRYKELEMYDFISNPYSEYGRGVELAYRRGHSAYPTEAVQCNEVGELTDSNREWLENLYQLSEEAGFELVLFLSPTMLNVEEQKQVNAAKEFADERGITFFDFNRLTVDVGLDYNTDFIDQTHLNAFGAEKLTRYFGRYFDATYSLGDYRGDEAYYQWEKSYQYYEHTKAAAELVGISSWESYIQKLQEMRDVTYVVSFEGIYKESTLELGQYAKLLGLTDEQYEIGGTFIFAEDKMEHVLDNESDEVVVYELNKYDSFKIQNMQLVNGKEGGLDDVMLNTESVGTTFAGMNIAVYDNFREKLIDKRGCY